MNKNPIPILYEDDYYIIFNKPANLLVIPTAEEEKNTLVNIANQQYPSVTEEYKLHPCHRIDRETSGIIIFAKGKKNQAFMMDEFKKRTIKKEYVAFVRGKLKNKSGEIKRPIINYKKKFRNKHVAEPALTRYIVMSIQKLYSVVRVFPITGRTNQIRIHFSELGHPLVGDRKYSFGKDFTVKFRRAALHASKITFTHPVTRKNISVTCEIPEDMRVFLNHE